MAVLEAALVGGPGGVGPESHDRMRQPQGLQQRRVVVDETGHRVEIALLSG